MSESIDRYKNLDGLRALSAIGIVLMHVQANGNYEMEGILFEKIIPSFTNLVFLFMAISGFSMCCGYYQKILNGQISLEKFYNKRFAKVWPFFACLNVLDLVISPSIHSLQDLVANLTMCFGLIPNNEIEVIGVGWFLGLVFVFYLLFPFFCYLLSNRKRAWISTMVALLMNYLCIVRFQLGRENIVYSAVFFFLGGMVFLYKEELQKVVLKHSWIVLVGIVAAIGWYYVVGSSVPSMLFLFGLLLIFALKPETDGKTFLRNPVLQRISDVSMEIYLSHMVVYRMLEKLHIVHLFQSDILSYMVMSVLTIIGTIVFSWIAGGIIRKIFTVYRSRKIVIG